LNACPDQRSATALITTDFTISHKNPNAAGIKVISSLGNDAPLFITLCSAETSYQFEIDSRKSSAAESVHFVDRSAIAPGIYEVGIKYVGELYRLENPFINKAATR